ncbi:MAG: hypothetical protein CFE37_07450 [Alphaproteobacteria bacterium PA4]|nr:MAG: hypothetical protein CFE37_07450 [Alphaproteobacteria bacterium PA4]
MRDDPLGFLPALFAAVLLALAPPASAMPLCSQGNTPPRQQDCDKACHFACQQRRVRPTGGVAGD